MFCTLFALWLIHWASLPWSVWEAAEVSGMPTLEWDEGPTLPTLLMKKLLTITNTETIYLDIYIYILLLDWLAWWYENNITSNQWDYFHTLWEFAESCLNFCQNLLFPCEYKSVHCIIQDRWERCPTYSFSTKFFCLIFAF